jgi:hypothetical protein
MSTQGSETPGQFLNGGEPKETAGGDTIVFDVADTLRVDGGSGTDTLQFDGSSQSLNLTAIIGDLYTGFEEIDLTNGNNSLIINEADVLRITDGLNALADSAGVSNAANTLIVTGNDLNDSVSVNSSSFTDSGTDVTISGNICSVYNGDSTDATLLVDNVISASLA